MRLIGERFNPEIAVLPIGGHYTMGPRDAALALDMIGASTVIPVHYATFPALAGTPAAARRPDRCARSSRSSPARPTSTSA